MATNYLEQSLLKLKEFEGCVPWMYRDTAGKVTVGVGLMLPDAQAAEGLPFLAGSRRPATAQEVAAEFDRVLSLPAGRACDFYKVSSSLELAESTIDARLKEVLLKFESDLRSRFHQYDSFPDSVKMGLLDMIYNLGPEGLLRGFPHLVAAIDARAWSRAAACCLRHGPGTARNGWTRQQFLGGVVSSIDAQVESLSTRIRRGIRLMLDRLFARGR